MLREGFGRRNSTNAWNAPLALFGIWIHCIVILSWSFWLSPVIEFCFFRFFFMVMMFTHFRASSQRNWKSILMERLGKCGVGAVTKASFPRLGTERWNNKSQSLNHNKTFELTFSNERLLKNFTFTNRFWDRTWWYVWAADGTRCRTTWISMIHAAAEPSIGHQSPPSYSRAPTNRTASNYTKRKLCTKGESRWFLSRKKNFFQTKHFAIRA